MEKETTPSPTGRRRLLQGQVRRKSGDKTIAVAIQRVKVHPVYHKRSTVTRTFLVHDPKNEAQVGDMVTIQEHRPLSRHKRWILVTGSKN